MTVKWYDCEIIWLSMVCGQFAMDKPIEMDDFGEAISGRSIDKQHYYMLFEYLDYLDNQYIYIHTYCNCNDFWSLGIKYYW